MHDGKENESVVLRVNLSLETLAGERIAEVKTEDVFQHMLGPYSLGSAETALLEMLEVRVASPCRALIRAHLHQHRERTGQVGKKGPQIPTRWGDNAIVASFNHRLGAVMAQTQSETAHAACLPVPDSSR